MKAVHQEEKEKGIEKNYEEVEYKVDTFRH